MENSNISEMLRIGQLRTVNLSVAHVRAALELDDNVSRLCRRLIAREYLEKAEATLPHIQEAVRVGRITQSDAEARARQIRELMEALTKAEAEANAQEEHAEKVRRTIFNE